MKAKWIKLRRPGGSFLHERDWIKFIRPVDQNYVDERTAAAFNPPESNGGMKHICSNDHYVVFRSLVGLILHSCPDNLMF